MIFIILIFNKTAKCQRTALFLKDFIKNPIFIQTHTRRSRFHPRRQSTGRERHRRGSLSRCRSSRIVRWLIERRRRRWRRWRGLRLRLLNFRSAGEQLNGDIHELSNKVMSYRLRFRVLLIRSRRRRGRR